MLKNRAGVSIVVCCHNSASRLSPTLTHLMAQQMSQKHISWEVIVVDNASTDDTATLARNLWSKETPASLRVVNEPQQGLIYARIRGFEEARFELVSFVDDDNWVCPQWVQTVSELMSQHPDVGACGGQTTAVCEIMPPSWFERHATKYAVGQQAPESRDITDTRGYLWGAGLTIRKSAWQQLVNAGFQPVLSGRQEGLLSTGEDGEICLALRLAGWRLWYDQHLTLQHYLPVHRLEYSYLRRLQRQNGAAFVVFDTYPLSLSGSNSSMIKAKQIWGINLLHGLKALLAHYVKWLLSGSNPAEREDIVLSYEFYQGKFVELLKRRRDYHQMIERVQILTKQLKTASKEKKINKATT